MASASTAAVRISWRSTSCWAAVAGGVQRPGASDDGGSGDHCAHRTDRRDHGGGEAETARRRARGQGGSQPVRRGGDGSEGGTRWRRVRALHGSFLCLEGRSIRATEPHGTVATVSAGGRTLLTGWGRTSPSSSEVMTVAAGDREALAAAVKALPARGGIPRGLGRSYGDSAQNGGGAALRLLASPQDVVIDASAGTATVPAGLSIDDLLRLIVPRGWFVPVSPGTRFVTVGGARRQRHPRQEPPSRGFVRQPRPPVVAAPCGRRGRRAVARARCRVVLGDDRRHGTDGV